MKNRLLLLGATGQVGSALQSRLSGLGEVTALSRAQLDLGSEEALRAAVRSLRPAVIINAAAYTAVESAEGEPELARRVNGIAPGILAEEAVRCRALLVHYSTDYVFDGQHRTPYREEDSTGPLNEYGRSKLLGEERVAAAGGACFIVRTGWVYAARGKNFLLTMLRLGGERESLRVVDDQTGTPTPATVVAEATLAILRHSACAEYDSAAGLAGIYHAGCAGQTSWFRFAQSIFAAARETEMGARLKMRQLLPISSEEYRTAARRPRYSVLAKDKIARVFGWQAPAWETGLAQVMQELAPAGASQESA